VALCAADVESLKLVFVYNNGIQDIFVTAVFFFFPSGVVLILLKADNIKAVNSTSFLASFHCQYIATY